MAYDRSIRQSLAPSPSPSPNIVGRGSCLPATNDRCGLRGDRLCAMFQTLFDGYVSALSRHRSYVTVSGALTPLSTRNLRLYFRLVNGSAPRSLLLSPLSHTDGHVLPPTEAMPPTSQAPGTATLILRLRRYARPRPRCTVRLCTDSAPAVGQPLHSLRVCLRLRARAGRHTVLVQAHDKVPVAPCLHDTCRLL